MSREAMKLALETSEGIVNADWRKWDELASPSEFERWAKSRANFMATILREALAEQPAQSTAEKSELETVPANGGLLPAQQALDKMAENARELGLDYEPAKDNSNYKFDPPGLDPLHQKPVAWWIPKAKQFCLPSSDGARPFAKAWEPLYTSPPASKPWVGLTDEDKQIAFDDTQEGGGFWEFADAIEAKLREKNT